MSQRVIIPIDFHIDINPTVPGQVGWTREEMRDELMGYLRNELSARDPGLGWMARSDIGIQAVVGLDVLEVTNP